MFEIALRQASYRNASEDRALTLEIGKTTLLLAIADGVGGQPGGGEAAALAIETIELESQKLAQQGKRLLPGFFHALDDALAAHSDAGQTTLVALCVTPQKILGTSVGDSEAWWITAEGHFDLTEAQKRKPLSRNGSRRVPVPFELKLTQPGTLLLATDGLFKYADPLAITEAVRTAEGLEAAADALLTLAAPAGRYYDDLALILVRLDTIGTIGPWTSFLNRFKAG